MLAHQKKIKNYIGGSFLEPKSKKYLKNYKPATGKVYSLIPDSCKDDVDLAVRAAEKAFVLWSNKTKQARFKILMSLVNKIEESFEILVKAESEDTGKPEWLTRSVDIPRCSENIRFFATASLHFDSKLHDMDGQAINYTLKEPFCVVGVLLSLIGLQICVSLVVFYVLQQAAPMMFQNALDL